MPTDRIKTWFSTNWFPLLTMAGFGFHASYTIGSIQHEFESLRGRMTTLEERTRPIPEITWRVTNAETARLELRGDIARLSDKQDVMDAKLNRIIGSLALDRKVAVTP